MEETTQPTDETPKPEEIVIPDDIESMDIIDLYHWAHTTTPKDWKFEEHLTPEQIDAMREKGRILKDVAVKALESQQELATRLTSFVVADNFMLYAMAGHAIVEAIGFAWAIAQERWGLVIPVEPK